MRMSSFISNVCRNVYLQIRTISHIRDFISEDVAKKLVTSFVLSKLDYCNSLFVGLSDNQIKRLQVAQNSAARLIKRQGRRCHITPILYDLHWLPVQQRIQYKICFFVFKCINNLAPSYLKSMVQLYIPNEFRKKLRSSVDTFSLVNIDFNYKKYGERSFLYQSAKIWNRLPLELRECTSIDIFKVKLKTHLFENYFG